MKKAFSPEIDRAINYIVNGFYSKQQNKYNRHLNNTREDLLSEAHLAAVIAIRKYDAAKKCKIQHYIAACVRNHLTSLLRKSFAEKNPECLSSEMDSIPRSPQHREDIILEAAANRLLTKKEYEIFSKIVVGDYTSADIVKEYKKENQTSESSARRRVRECFSHILQKLNLFETNQLSSYQSV